MVCWSFDLNRFIENTTSPDSTFERTISATFGIVVSAMIVAGRYRKCRKQLGIDWRCYLDTVKNRRVKKKRPTWPTLMVISSLVVLIVNLLPVILGASKILRIIICLFIVPKWINVPILIISCLSRAICWWPTFLIGQYVIFNKKWIHHFTY